MIPIRVECYSGSRAEETPRLVSFGGDRFEIEEIIDRWYEAGLDPEVGTARYFKVRAGPKVFVVKHDEQLHAWFLVAEHRTAPPGDAARP